MVLHCSFLISRSANFIFCGARTLNHLLYCIAEPGVVPPQFTGVGGAPVESVDVDGLRCFYSVVDSLGGDAGSLKRDALDYHRVTRELFRQSAVIPFRFPSTLGSVAQIVVLLHDHAQAYRAALADFRDKVQMEIRIGGPNAPAASAASSGTGYLKDRAQRTRRLEQAIAACRAAIHEEVVDWRQRESSHGVRCFALIRREVVNSFQERILRVRLEGDVTATLSGPWPPTEFLPVFHG